MILRYFIFIALYCTTSNVSLTFAEDTATTADALNKLVQDFENFKKQLDSVDSRLKTIQNALEQKVTSDDSKCLTRDIVDAINNRRLDLAEDKLSELGSTKRIAYIVHDVYADSAINLDKIVEFAKNLKNGEYQFLFFNAILNEIRSSGESDPKKLIEIVELLETVMSKQSDKAFKARVKTVIDNAIEDIKSASISLLKLAMVKNKYQITKEVEDLTTALYEFRSDVSNNVMDGVVDSAFGVVSASRIMDNISSQKNIPQVISGLKAIFNRFNYAGNLNNDATLNLAAHLRMLTKREKYSEISPELRDEVVKIVEQLPICARNLFFNTRVCFWNRGRGQYLYAADTSISYDPERRSIYTWHPGGVQPGSLFYAERMGDSFYFKNEEHFDEYLYSVGIDFNKDMRYVFTWIAGNNTDAQSAWGIELDGDYCYIKTTYYNEYLFAPAMKYNQDNNYVFTWKPGTLVRSPEFQWQVRSCEKAHTLKDSST
ncbi:uncharacterized protein LOC129917903 [Episyrphus balteatus]|uniref:uncharacterized protein LOC129917903 n=1 Tax=Episyrphus balteatus TaxID=286459 RepID=UPI0024852045|nr:uncharacterized protein LOC129917903 [Episyrphus balteatus]